MIRKHIILTIIVFLAIFSGTIVFTNLQSPIFESGSTIGIFTANQIINPFATQQVDITTYAEILKSNAITEMVTEDTDYTPDTYKIEIEQPRNTNILRITVQSPNRIAAKEVADSFAENFIRYNLERKQEVSLSKKLFIESQLEEYYQEISYLQEQLLDYANKSNLTRTQELDKLSIERDIQVKSKLYNELLLKSDEIKISSVEETGEISIIDRAVLPLEPIKPNKPLNYVLGFVIGIFAGVALAIVIESAKDSFLTAESIERETGIPVLGEVPKIKRKGKKMMLVTSTQTVMNKIKNQFAENPAKFMKRYCLQELYPESHFADQIRKLRTNIAFEVNDKSAKIICVTSPRQEEGKTTVAINLGISFAHYKKKVLLVDANLASPMLAKVFELDGKGLTDALFPSASAGRDNQEDQDT